MLKDVFEYFPICSNGFESKESNYVSLYIVDSSGKIVLSKMWNSTATIHTSLEIQSLASGSYYLVMTSGKQKMTEAFIKL